MKKSLRKILAAMLVAITLLIAAPANAEIQTFEGVGEYYVGEEDVLNDIWESARQKARQDAQNKAGIFIKTFSLTARSVNLTDNDIMAIISDTLKIRDEMKTITKLANRKELLMRADVKAQIDTDEIIKWLDRSQSEREAIIAQDKDLQKVIAERDKELAEYKKKLAEHERLAKETPKENKPAPTQQVGGQIFEGVGEYRLGSSETIINAEKGAKILAMQDALEKAGILVDRYAQAKDFELDKDVITVKSRAILKVIDTKPEWKDFVCRTTIKVDINVAELNKWLEQEAKKST